MTDHDEDARTRLTRRGTAWLCATCALLVAATALGVAALVTDLPDVLAWTWLVVIALGVAAATVTSVVVGRDTGVSAPRTLGRALLAPVRFLLELV
jgi:hypothetical protein